MRTPVVTAMGVQTAWRRIGYAHEPGQQQLRHEHDRHLRDPGGGVRALRRLEPREVQYGHIRDLWHWRKLQQIQMRNSALPSQLGRIRFVLYGNGA